VVVVVVGKVHGNSQFWQPADHVPYPLTLELGHLQTVIALWLSRVMPLLTAHPRRRFRMRNRPLRGPSGVEELIWLLAVCVEVKVVAVEARVVVLARVGAMRKRSARCGVGRNVFAVRWLLSIRMPSTKWPAVTAKLGDTKVTRELWRAGSSHCSQ
jgi:hypothetical protein